MKNWLIQVYATTRHLIYSDRHGQWPLANSSFVKYLSRTRTVNLPSRITLPCAVELKLLPTLWHALMIYPKGGRPKHHRGCDHVNTLQWRYGSSYCNLQDTVSFSLSWWLFSFCSGDCEILSNRCSVFSTVDLLMLKVLWSVVNNSLCASAFRGTRSHHDTSHSGQSTELS